MPSRSAEPDWRTLHCADLAVAAVAAASGRDVWGELGGRPGSWREAAALYRRLGVRDLAGAVSAVLGPPLSPRRAMRGDIIMVRGALGVCRGELAECIGANVPMGEASSCWPATRR